MYSVLSRLFFSLTQIGVCRDAEDRPCEIYILQEETCKERVIDEVVVYNSKFKTDFGR